VDTLREADRFEAWFRRIVNTCRDRLRRRSRSDTDLAQQRELTTPDEAPAVTERVRVEQVLGRLKPDDRVLAVEGRSPSGGAIRHSFERQ
jgi:DNA-directed RNA polymerase specialized sigma24 family protein